MILDRLVSAERYCGLHPKFAAAFEFLRKADGARLAPGRVEIDGALLYVVVDEKPGRGRAAARLEVHRKYIDIQFVVSGCEEIGWKPAAACCKRSADYNQAKDIEYFADPPDAWVAVPPGALAIFFPDDAHAPLAGTGPVKKLIVKVAI